MTCPCMYVRSNTAFDRLSSFARMSFWSGSSSPGSGICAALARLESSSFALVWSCTIRRANCFTASFCAFPSASRPKSTSAAPPAAWAEESKQTLHGDLQHLGSVLSDVQHQLVERNDRQHDQPKNVTWNIGIKRLDK